MTIQEIHRTIRDNQRQCRYRFKLKTVGCKKMTVERLFVNGDGNIYRFIRGSRTQGHPMDMANITMVIPVIPTHTDGETAFRRNLDRCLSILRESGMWPDLREQMEFFVGKDLGQMEEWYGQCYGHTGPDGKWAPARQDTVPEEFHASTFGMVKDARIKKMRFGKEHSNGYHLAQIADAIGKGGKLSFRIDADRSEGLSYDTSFEYNPDGRRGWYSEEYRNCGNGHYWLAISPTHALFCEDD